MGNMLSLISVRMKGEHTSGTQHSATGSKGLKEFIMNQGRFTHGEAGGEK
jgi:hypothetical protein